VYSQFDSKADLFLALAGQRIQERAAEHAELAAKIAGISCTRSVICRC
jgi:hypothetical protein